MAITNNNGISSFLTSVKNGVRPNLFEVTFAFPSGVDATALNLTSHLCKAAALPASNLGVIEVPYRGRVVKIAGDRTFDTWTATFINDKDFKVREAFENWMQKINYHERNTADYYVPDSGANGYLADLVVKQLDRQGSGANDGAQLATYKLWGCFPTNISQIDLAYDSNDQIEDFTVEFQLQYWTRGAGSNETDKVIGQ
jgi:hypothetical protein